MAMNFVGASTQSLTITSGLSVFQNVTGASLMCWVNLQGTLPSTETFLVFYSTNSTSTGRLALSFRGQISRFRTSARRLDADTVTSVDGTTAPVSGTLYHVCAVAQYNSTTLRLYVNGVQENTATIAGWTGASSNTASAGAWMARNSGGGNTTGLLTDVRAYNRALSAQEISIIYGARGRDTVVAGMLDRWKMMDGVVGATGTPASVGTLQSTTSQTNSPLFAENLGIATRARSF